MRKHNYVVGYEGEGQCIYGKDDNTYNYIDLLTLWQAQKLAKRVVCQQGKKINKSIVYKLVEVKNGNKSNISG